MQLEDPLSNASGFFLSDDDDEYVNTMQPRQSGSHIAKEIFKFIFLNGNRCIMFLRSNKSSLVQMMVWCRIYDKQLYEKIMIYVTVAYMRHWTSVMGVNGRSHILWMLMWKRVLVVLYENIIQIVILWISVLKSGIWQPPYDDNDNDNNTNKSAKGANKWSSPDCQSMCASSE